MSVLLYYILLFFAFLILLQQQPYNEEVAGEVLRVDCFAVLLWNVAFEDGVEGQNRGFVGIRGRMEIIKWIDGMSNEEVLKKKESGALLDRPTVLKRKDWMDILLRA